MKLRLPHRLQAAILTAFASVTFFTVGTATLGAARGEEAPEFASFTDTGVEVSEEELEVDLGEEEEEETKEPDSAPSNHAGFNGIYGSSDDFDRQSTAEATTEASIDTENVGTSDQANYTGTSADLPSDDLGFTSNPYASGSDTSNSSGVDSPVTSFTQAPQIAPTGGDSAAGIGSGSSTSNETTTSPGVSIGSGLGAFGGGYYPAFAAAPSLTSVPAAAGPGAAASTNLGKFLFMGDSITHGVVDQTYRWQMFKGFVDNGISFDLNGPIRGYASAPTNMNDAGSAYGNVTFENVHYAKSSGRSGDMLTGNRYGSKVTDVGKTDYDTYTLMIGTNDLLSDTASGADYSAYKAKMEGLLGGTVTYSQNKSLSTVWTWTQGESMSGNLNTILNALNLGAGDNFYILSVPDWAEGHNNHNGASDHAAVTGYNTILQQWVQAYDAISPANVHYVDVNKGLTDVTVAATRGDVAPFDFFSNNDRLHPSQQGSIIIGGNLSRGMGLAGRTAGLHRADTTGWTAADSSITLASGASQEIARDVFIENGGYTIDFHATFGDGANNNWLDAGIHTGNMNAAAQNVLAITIGDGINGGTLNLAEGYIMWGSNILYCQDNSQSSNDAIRIAYHNGSTADNVAEGYYVWLGDMLIGQGLSSTPGLGWNGIKVSSTGGTATLTGLMYTDTAYAPETDFAVGSNPYYVTQDRGQTVLVPTREAASDHHANPIPSGVDWTTATPVSYTGSGTARYAQDGAGSSGVLKAVAMNLTSSGQSSWIAAKGGNANYTGDIALQLVEGSYGCATVFGVVNGATLDGNATVELNSSSATITSFTGTAASSLIGGYKGSITGTFKGVVNAGTLSNDIVGGFHTADSGNHIGAVELIVNGGTVNGNVYGGSVNNASNGRIDGNIAIKVTDGTINGSIIGTGTAGTIGGSQINIVLSGGVITGDVMGRNSGFNYAGTTNVTVDGYKPLIKGNITADNVTLRGVEDTEYAGYMDTYRGTVTGNSSIILDNYTAKDVMAKLVTQDLTVSGTTNTTIHDLTLTSCSITAGEGTDLTLADSLTLGNAASFSGNITLADGLVIDMTAAGEHQGYSDGDNGYLNNVVVFKQADNAAAGSSIEADWSTIQGAGALQGATFSQDASGKVTAGGITTGSYHITTGTVYYGGPNAPEDIKTAHDLILEPTSSATLVMAANFEPDCVGGISVAAGAQGARLRINAFQEDGTTPIVILASNVHANAGLVLEGDGTYALSNLSGYTAANGYGLGANVSLDPAWKGTVLVSSSTSTDNNNLINFSKLGNSLSTVELNGLTGWATSWAGGTIEQNIKLTNNDGAVAWKNSASNSSGNIPLTNFTGTWSGDGTFEVAPGGSNQRSNYTFSGDISAWTGKLLRSGAGTTVFTFAGDAHEVNADIERTGGDVSLVVNTDTVFKKNVTDINNGLTVANGKHATFEGTTSISGASTIGGTIYNNGAMTLAGTGTVNLSGNEGAFELYNEAGGNTYSNGDSGYLTSGSAYYYLIKGGENSTLSGSPTIANTKLEGNSLIVSGTADTGLYYVNRDLAYSDDMADATGFVIKAGTTLSATSSDALPTPTKQLHGEGTYALASGASALNGNLTLGTDWTGTVRVSGVNNSGLQLGTVIQSLRQGNSWVELSNVAGKLDGNNVLYAGNIILTDTADATAMRIIASTSGNNTHLTGDIKGEGSIERRIGNGNTLTFDGDLSGWTGAYYNGGKDGGFNAGWNVVNFTHGGEINADFINRARSTGCYLTLVYEADTTVKGDIYANPPSGSTVINVTANANTTFMGTVNVNTLTVAQGKTATMATDATISGVTTNNGNLVLRNGTTYTVHATSGGQTQNLGNIVVEKSATIVDTNFNATMNFTTITGGEGGTLTLLSSHSASTSEWNLGVAGQTQASPFGGKLVLMSERDGDNNRAANFNFVDGTMFSGAEVQIKNGTDVTNYTLTNTLKLKAANVTIGGLSDAAADMVTDKRKWSVANGTGQGSATLTLNGSDTYTSDIKLESGVNLAMNGTGTQTFNGDLSAMNGEVSVSAGTLTLNNSSDNKGSLASVSVTGGTLNLDNMNVAGATEVTGGMLNLTSSVQTSGLTVATGTTLKLAGENELTVNGLLTLQTGATLDLANIFATQAQEPVLQAAPKSGGLLGAVEPASGATYVLATANDISLQDGVLLDNIVDGYRGTLSTQDATGGSGKELILTLAELSKNLIWDNNAQDNKWDVATTQNWHKDGEQAGSSTFAEGDNVTFASNAGTAQLQTDINAGTMTLQSGANLTVDTNSHNLTVASLVSADGSNLTKSGAGTATFGGDANTPVSLGTLTVSGGTANFEGGPVTANTFTTSGTGTTVSFDEKVTVTGPRVAINFNWDATSNSITFAKGLEYTGSGTNGYAMAIGNGDTVMLGGESDFHDKALGIAGGRNSATGKLVLLEDATLSIGRTWNTNTAAENGAVELREGSVLNISGNGGGSTISKLSGSGTVNVNAQTLLVNGHENFTGDIALANTGALDINATNFGGKIANTGTGTVTMYGTAGQVANENARIAVTKKNDQELTLISGSEKAISKVTVANGSTKWLFAENIPTNDDGLYTDIEFLNTGNTQNGLIIKPGSTTANIGSLSAVSSNTTVRGDYNDGGNRVLAVHQDTNTTFAGQFVDNDARSIGLDKYGTGTLTLTAANGSESALNIYAGAIKLDGANAKWTGATTVYGGGTLELTSSVAALANNVTINSGGTLALGNYKDDAVTAGNLTLASGSILDLSNLSFTGDEKGEITLINGGAITVDNLSAVTLNFSDSTLQERATLSKNGNNLVLTFTQPEPGKDLIWDGGSETWDVGTTSHWHEAESTEHVAFSNNDNAIFDSASANATATMDGAVTAGSMTVADGANVTIVTGAGDTLTVTNGITVAEGGTLALQGSGLSGTLQGGGTYVLPTNTGSLGNVQLGNDWEGTVQISGNMENFYINNLATENSWVEAKGVTGYPRSWASGVSGYGDTTCNLKLTDSDDGSAAFTYTAGSLTARYTAKFTGDIVGDGTFAAASVARSQDAYEDYEFSGNISGWNGTFRVDRGRDTAVSFTGDADVVNAAIDRNGHTLGMKIGTADAAQQTTFNNTVDVSSLTLANADSSATFMGNTEIGTLSGAGTLVVDGAKTTIGSGSNFTGDIDLLGGTLDLTSALTGVGEVNLGGSAAATLKLAGGENALTSTSSITLGDNLTLDLSNYNSYTVDQPVTLATATGFSGDAGSVSLTGLNLEEGYKARLSVENTTDLVLTVRDESEQLYWLDPSGTWTARNTWYNNDQETRNTFQPGDSVTIVGNNYDDDVSTTIRMVADASARKMVVTKDESVTDTTVTIKDTVNENRLAAKTLVVDDDVTLVANTQLEVTETAQLKTNSKLELNSPKDATISAAISSEDNSASITKQGGNTLTLTGDNSGYTGSIEVTAGTLAVQGINSLGNGTVSVADDAKLSLENRGAMNGGSLTLGDGSTISFLGDTELTLSGSLTLGNGVTWDLSRYGFDRPAEGQTTTSATLITLENPGVFDGNFGDYFINAPGIVSNAELSYKDGSVILTYSMPEQGDLYWKGGAGSWNTDSDNLSWYPMKEGGDLTSFYTKDNVFFDDRAAVSSVTLTEDITAGTVTVENGTRVTLHGDDASLTAGNIVVQGSLGTEVNVDAATVSIAGTGTWTVSGDKDRAFAGELAGTGTLAKNGSGDLELSHDNSAFTGDIQLHAGSITAANANALGTGTTIVMGNGSELKQADTLENAINMGGKTIEVTNSGANATVSANLDVAQGTVLTFAGDGTLDVTGTMSGSGTITQSGYGVTNIGNLNGFNGTLNIDHGTLVMQSAYDGSAIVNVNMGSTLQFASNVNGEGQAATPLTLTRLTMDAGTYFDVSNITLGTVNINGTNVPNAAVLAIVSSGTINDFPHSMETESGARGEADVRMIEGVALSGTEHFFGEGASLDDNSYLRLRYAYQSGNLVVYLQASYPEGVYWNAESYEAEWENTDKPIIKSWNVDNGGTLESNTYYRSGMYGGSLHAPDAYFMKKYFDENNNPVGAIVNMNPTSIQYVGDVIFGEQTDYTINGYYLSLSVTPNGGYSNKEKSYNSAMVVRSGADIKINAAVNAGDGTLVETERDARFIINADIGDKLAGVGAAVSIFNGHNAGYTEINADGINIGSYINDGTMHVKHLDTILFVPGMADDPFASDVKYITNTKTGVMSFSTDVLAPFMAANETGYDPNILNEGKLYFLSQDDLGIDMYEDVPVRGRGEVYTGGTHGVIFDISPYLQGFTGVYAPASVQASKLELDAASTTFNYGVDITDTTTVKAGKDAYFYGGTGVGGPGSLGEVTLETGATMTFGPFAEVAYGLPTGEYTAKTYDMGLVNAGADSVLTVQNGATVTMDGFNAASGVPAGGIVVGTTRSGAEEASLGDASLVIGREDNLDAEANVDVFTVLNGTATVNGNASINQIMQDGGVLTLKADSVLNGTNGNGGTVTGGTLSLASGTTLDQNAVIDVRNVAQAESGGTYTVSGPGSRIDASDLELKVDRDSTLFREVVIDEHGDASISDKKTSTQSGFMASGDEYVKLFDMGSGTTLTSNNEAVYHASASGLMTLIGNDNWEAIRDSIGSSTFDVQAHIGYGYLHTAELARKTYYVRDTYTTNDRVTLSNIIDASADTEHPDGQLENVVFDKTEYNTGFSPYNGTLTVDEDTSVDLFSVSDGTKAAINIADGTTVKANAASPGVAGSLDLEGEGVYEITDRNDLGTNIGLRDDEITAGAEWDGTVRVTGTSTDLVIDNMSVGKGSDASTIEFKDWNGALNGGEHTSDGKIVLTSTQDSPTAMKLTGEDDIDYTFTNTVTGSGSINHAEGGNVAMTFTGDTAGWTGTYEQNASTEDSLTFTGGTKVSANVTSVNGSMDLTYGGTVTTVAGNVNAYSGGDTPTTMNVTYTGADKAVTGGITSDAQSQLTLTVGDGTNPTTATFTSTFTDTGNATMAVKDGSTAVIGTNAELLRVLGDEGSNVVVNQGSTLSLASTNPETGYSEFHDLTNEGTIEMKASGGEIHLVDDTAEGNTYNLGELVLTDPVGTATIETSGVEGKTTNVNITGLTGPKSAAQVLELTNGNGTGTVNYNLGNTDDTKDLNGTIAYGGSGGVTNLVLQENGNSAASAVLETRFTSADAVATANIVVDAEAARVLGLSSDGNSANKAMKVSGREDPGDPGNRTLNITGDGNYTYAGTLGSNLDIAYTGDGSQTIEGGVENFSGKVTVNNNDAAQGILEILNASSVSITDLTIGTNNTLDLNDGSNVGTAVVSGTMTAGGTNGAPSTLDGSLTLGSGSTYDVSAAGGTGGLNLTGALTITQGAMLSTGDMGVVWNMGVGDTYDLAFGVTDMTSFGTDVDWNQGVDASTVFGNGMKEGEYYIRYSGDSTGGKGGNVGAVYLFRVAVPEPATGSLSLLALAALAARRRKR